MRKHFKQLSMFVIIVTTLLLTCNCKKDESNVNQPPAAPVNPSPANNEDSVSYTSAMSWSVCADPENDSVKYDVYLGTSNPPTLVKNNILLNSYTPNTLLKLTKYYWKVVAKDNKNNASTSPVWNFTTAGDNVNQPPAAPTNPTPANNEDSVSPSTALNWSVCTDPENDNVYYDVYISTNNPPALVISNILLNSYTPGTLTPYSKYYWKVVAKDNLGHSASSPVWNFTVGQPSQPPGDLKVLVCDATHTNYFGGAEVFLYKSDADRTNDPQRTNYYRKATTDNSDPMTIGAVFYVLTYQKYYVFVRFDLGGGNFLLGIGESFVPTGMVTTLIVTIN